jgi:hypothetical protein
MATRLLPAVLLALAGCGAVAGTASAKGVGLAAAGEVTVDGSPHRYAALSPRTPGNRLTVVTQTDRRGRISRWWHLRGSYRVPPLTYNGSAGGLSADGGTLVLSRFSWIYPPRTTGLAILDTRVHLRHPGRAGERRPRHAVTRVRLRGSFSFDAISPDGSTIYLIHHLSPVVDGPYRVRALDAKSGELLPGSIVDPSEPDERMTGLPIDRATSPDGRWAYTLYGGKRHEPFVHALDTVAGRAVCIDLPQLWGRGDPFSFALRTEPGGRELAVLNRRASLGGSRPLLIVDTKSFEVSEADGRAAGAGVGVSWPAVAVASAFLAFGIALTARRRRGAAAG